MKRKFFTVFLVSLGLLGVFPGICSAWRVGVGVGYSSGWGPYRPHWHGYYGWHRPRVYVGATFVNPWYVYPPPVYIYAPPVVYRGPVSRSAYAYPDPGFAERYRTSNPPGEWVTVPGQWVNGKWVQSHKAWVPVNP